MVLYTLAEWLIWAVLLNLYQRRKSILTASIDIQRLRHIYLFLYVLGGFCSLLSISLLGWIAFCIAMEMEPLASIAFLPNMPTPLIFILLLAIMAIGIACWQTGAKYHVRYEQASHRHSIER